LVSATLAYCSLRRLLLSLPLVSLDLRKVAADAARNAADAARDAADAARDAADIAQVQLNPVLWPRTVGSVIGVDPERDSDGKTPNQKHLTIAPHYA
jgi:hypothetical protein